VVETWPTCETGTVSCALPKFDILTLLCYNQLTRRSYPTESVQSNMLHERLRQYQAHAVAALEAVGLVGVALPQEDIQAIRERAAATGMSYQAFIANILHQYVTGNLVEKPRSA